MEGGPKARGAAWAGDDLARAHAHCARVTRRASSNFYYAFFLLPAARRRALCAVYAFCRFIDDIADRQSVREPGALLARWREELDRVFAGAPTHPISRALADSVARFGLRRELFEEIIAGVEMDLTLKRYQSFEGLKVYCYRVASAVGLICIEIFGYRNPATRSYAEQLGIAFQLTNILRDVGEDARRDRIYLPLEDLERFSVSEEEVLRGVFSPRFQRLMEFQALRAQQHYQAARRHLAPEDRASMASAEAMRRIYSALLERIRRSGYRVLSRRHSLSTARKLAVVGAAWLDSRLGGRLSVAGA